MIDISETPILTDAMKAEIENAMIDSGVGQAYDVYPGFHLRGDPKVTWAGNVAVAVFEFLPGDSDGEDYETDRGFVDGEDGDSED